MEKSPCEKNSVIWVTSKDKFLLISVTGICSYQYHCVIFSCRLLHFRSINLWENLYHFSWNCFNTWINMTRNTKWYYVIITKSTIVKLTISIGHHLGICGTKDTTFILPQCFLITPIIFEQYSLIHLDCNFFLATWMVELYKVLY